MRMQKLPKLVHHKTGQGRVRLGGKDFYCGKFGTAEAEIKYLDLVRLHLAGQLPQPVSKTTTKPTEDAPPASPAAGPPRSVETLAARYMVDHVAVHYRHPTGEPTTEAAGVRMALQWLTRCPEGKLPPDQFGPKALKAVRAAMVNSGRLSRKTINQHCGRLKRMFRWASSEELVGVNVYSALQTVAGLSRGRTEAPDHPPRQPVDWATISKSLPFLSAPLQAVVLVQWHCGARGGELLQARPCDIDQTGEIWRYTVPRHKASWRGKNRVILLGREAQAVLAPLLRTKRPEEFIFSPRDSRDQAGVRECYDSNTYVRQVARAAQRAGVAHWSPHQLRHAYASRIRKIAGIEQTRILLGHSSAVTSELYAAIDEESVMEIVSANG